MSLLMDALRRAEAEKAAARGAADGPAQAGADASRELGLEPLSEAGESRDRYATASEAGPPAYADSTTRGFRTASPTDEDPELVEFTFDEEATPPSLRLGGATGSLAQPAIATAQTVFEAGARSGAPRLLAGVIALTVLIAVALSAVGVYYYRQTPLPPPLPSPRVAQAVEPVAAAAHTGGSARVTGPAAAGAEPSSLPLAAAPAPAAADGHRDTAPAFPADPGIVGGSSPLRGSGSDPAGFHVAPPDDATGRSAHPGAASEAGPPDAAAGAGAAGKAGDEDAAGTGADGRAGEAPVARIAEPSPAFRAPAGPAVAAGTLSSSAIPRDAEIVAGEIRIARGTGGGADAARLQEAYVAYGAGDLPAARRLYEAVLAARPGQPDALLGLAAIALRGQRLPEAHRLYREVLVRDPGNAVASAALFMIEGGQGRAVTPARLQLLLDAGVASPYLHFALGNQHARESRWADAQQAFFEAFSGAPDNPDYAFNLAVSLDRMGQHAAALDYYRKALELAGRRSAAFNPERVAARVAALAGSMP